ncbi:MAG: 2Fe-2S iron-sulfur cluster-binding protein [Planctomycetota bacterium]|nr:2Fe-2S iron-sulfur cluster-binding protein [Planctomycetota bacterium]
MPKITFSKIKDKEKKVAEVPQGINLREAMIKHGVEVYSPLHKKLNCNGKGLCGSCRVHVKEGMENCSAPGALEKLRALGSFYAIGHEEEVRLSCQMTVQGDIKIEETPDFNLHGVDRKAKNTRAGYFPEGEAR